MVPPDDINPRQGIRGNRPRLRGEAILKPRNAGGTPEPPSQRPAAIRSPAASTAPPKKRVLFVCIGNSCRSQMAEAFARAYGADIVIPQSAGLAPATLIAPLTIQVLNEKNVTAEGQFPKSLGLVAQESFDVVVNMSGQPLVLPGARVLDWPVPDPIGQKPEVYRSVASQIEALIMRLVLDLRYGRL